MKKIKLTTVVLSLLFLSFFSIQRLGAQMHTNLVHWSTQLKKIDNKTADLIFTAEITSGWHIYSMDIPSGGPQATEFHYDKISGASLDGRVVSSVQPKELYDQTFKMNIGLYEGTISFTQKLKVTDFNALSIEGYVRYMCCNDENCTPPTNWDFTIGAPSTTTQKTETTTPAVVSTASKQDVSPKPAQATTTLVAMNTSNTNGVGGQLWSPVISQLKNFGDHNQTTANSSLLMLFLYGFLGGLIALLTPCVWPMIPMTVSFFLKRSKNRRKAIRDAVTYGIGIIVIYLALGLLITIIFGASALNDLATNAVFNIIFFLLLVFFAISFFGAFEIVLPSKWTNKMDAKADTTTGLLSIFFMAFTLVLVSFSCTGPIIGTLLVQAASMGQLLGPAIGMLGFAVALALPFTLFAIFPSMLQSMPKSGGWLNSVKVTLAFLELALSLKFLSVADLAYGWHILDRETFIALWIVIFALLGVYLLGKLRFSHDSPSSHTSVLGLFLAIISFGFAVYMLPGLWGAPLRSISAFAPPLKTQDFNLYNGEVHAQFDDYDTGMAYAKNAGKPVLIDFSGFGCVNCRKMEASVWTNPEVRNILQNDYVLISLMVDDKRPLPQPIEVKENGHTIKLRTIGDKWSYLQRVKFGANAQPYYVPLDNEGNPLSASRSYNENIKQYIDFLRQGLDNYKKKNSK